MKITNIDTFIEEFRNGRDLWSRTAVGLAVREIKRLRKRIAELEVERRWIPVSEREPEENRYVLVTDGKQVFEAKCYKKYDELKWVWQGYDIDENITHWMLKPQPPQDGE